jgi:prepilin-type N-terminal cleavage/methylation domain-containing protein
LIKHEQGYTLVELLITLALVGIIFTVTGAVMYQLSTVGAYGNDRLTLIHEMQNTAFWFNQDGQMSVAASGGSNLILTLPTGKTVTYGLSGQNLQRVDEMSTLTLAQDIAGVSFSIQDRLVSMSITALIRGRTDVNAQNTFAVTLRPVLP